MVSFANPDANQRSITRAFIAASDADADGEHVEVARLVPALSLFDLTLKPKPKLPSALGGGGGGGKSYLGKWKSAKTALSFSTVVISTSMQELGELAKAMTEPLPETDDDDEEEASAAVSAE